jgi:hypothetical protein
MPSEAHRELEANGFAIVPGAVGEAARQRLLSLLRPARLENAVRHRSGVVFACRHLLVHLPELAVELRRCGVNSLASQFIGKEAFPIDAVYFDKQSAANWAVPVHQDRVLPVATRSGDRHKTIRGVAVAEPSPATLTRLLALRIHFDPTDGENGALFVRPGSHTAGVLAPEHVQAAALTEFEPCLASAGDVLLMRPLLLHRSPPSRGEGQRRVLHVVYAAEQADNDLQWRSPT